MSTRDTSSPAAALQRLAEKQPEHVLLIADGEAWTTKRVATETARIAAGVAAGVRPGERVALHLYNTMPAALTLLACAWTVAGVPDGELGQRVGAVFVLNRDADLDDIVERQAGTGGVQAARTLPPGRVDPRNALSKVDRKSVTDLLSESS